jgi:hypothetical protein
MNQEAEAEIGEARDNSKEDILQVAIKVADILVNS